MEINSDFEKIYSLENGEEVKIIISDELDKIEVFNDLGDKIGIIELEESEFSNSYKLMYMYMDLKGKRYVRQGIGRECLLFFQELTGASLTANSNDGNVRDDGSHLTDDAPMFVGQMRNEGIVEDAGI